MSLEHHREFCDWLGALKNVDIAWHGLHHVHKGLKIGQEFQGESHTENLQKLVRIREIFATAGLNYTNGLCPPVWNAFSQLVSALDAIGNEYLASSRDIFSPVAKGAECKMSGIQGTPLIHACKIGKQGHIPTNFQATNTPDRAIDILNLGGILSIKAHVVKSAFGYVAQDALDPIYCNYLNLLFEKLKHRFGERLWWTSMDQINRSIRKKF